MMQQLFAQYGYLALFAGTFIEGETILIVAGFAAHQEYLRLWLVILTGFLGSLTGDQFYFFLGRVKGRPFLQTHSSWQVKAIKVDRLVDRYGTWIMLGFRFLYGLRTIIPLVIGTSRIRVSRFLVLNAAGAMVWSIVISCLGFLCGAAAESALSNAKKIEDRIALMMLGCGAIVWLVYFIRKKRASTKAASSRQ